MLGKAIDMPVEVRVDARNSGRNPTGVEGLCAGHDTAVAAALTVATHARMAALGEQERERAGRDCATVRARAMAIITHITDRHSWEQALAGGVYRPASLASEGFIHCSSPAQVVTTANLFFRGERELVLLCIDDTHLAGVLKWEPAVPASSAKAGELFPHVYGPLPVAAVVHVETWHPDADGEFSLPPDVERVTAGV